MSISLEGGHTETILTAAFTSDGKIVTGGEEGEICIWTLDGATVSKHKLSDTAVVTSFCCSKSDPFKLYASVGDSIQVLDTRQLPEPKETFNFNEDEINQIALDEKENFLAACDDSNAIKVICLREKRVYKTLRKHTNICATVCFRPRRAWDVVSGGYDQKLIQWDFSRGRSVCIIDMDEIGIASQTAGEYVINPPFIHSVAINPTGEYLACGTDNAYIHVFTYHKRTPEFHRTLIGHTKGVSQVHFPSFAEKHVISGGNDGKIFVWDLAGTPSQNISNGTSHGSGHNTNNVDPPHQGAAVDHAPANQQPDRLVPKFTIDHGEKINWITSGASDNGNFLVVVDNTTHATVYPYPH